jgi:hypothetical protein
MLVDDRPAQRVWVGPEWREDPQWQDDPGQAADWRGYFDDVVDVICPDAHSRGPRYGYGAEPRADQLARDGGRHVARHGKVRRAAGSRTGVATLAAAAVVGTGVGAGVLGVVPFMPPTTTSPGVTAHVPVASSAAQSGTQVAHRAGYVGKHRMPVVASSPAHLGTQAGSTPGASVPSGSAAYTPASYVPTSASAGSHQTGSSSAGASQTSPQSPGPSAPQSGGGSGSGGSGSASTPSSTGSGSSGSTSGSSSTGASSSNGGLVGGVVGGVTGLVGGLL